jgi:hypothetical protein
MSWLFAFGRAVMEGVVSAGRAIVAATAPVVIRVVETAHRVVNAMRDGINREFRTPPKTERERIERDLEEINSRIMALRARYNSAGSLTDADMREHRRLRERRDDLARELEAIDNVLHAEDISDERSQYHVVTINDDLSHVLQFHTGQHTTNKICSVCGRPMILQWNRKLTVARLADCFWGCTGYYFEPLRCRHTDLLTTSELEVFVNLNHQEFAMSPQELAEATLRVGPQRVREAMQDLLSGVRKGQTAVQRYRCPIHKERLLPKRKGDASSLLDEFFLGCPRWLPDKTGCNFVIKLKSAAQIAAVLDAAGMGSLMDVIDSSSTKSVASNVGKAWSPADDAALAREFDSGATIGQLCEKFARNEGGITARLLKLGRVAGATGTQ